MTSILRRALNLFRPDGLSRDIDREMDFHIDECVEELVASGMSRDAAEHEARRRFGNRTGLRERTRDADILTWLASFGADIRYALRTMRRSPGFTTIAVLSLALGIGANTAIFSLVNAVMLRSLPVAAPEELITVVAARPAQGSGRGFASYTNPLWETLRDRQHGVAQLFAYGSNDFDLSQGGVVRRVAGNMVSGGFFPILGVAPAAGRLLEPADDVRGCPAAAVISHGFAAREFGSPAAAVGKSISLQGHPFPVVGVVDRAFTGIDVGRPSEIYVPICSKAVIDERSGLDERGYWFLRIMGRLEPGVTLASAETGLAALAPSVYEATLPPDWSPEGQQRYRSRTLGAESSAGGLSGLRSSYAGALNVLFVVVGVVLLIACANVAHLLLARATTRQREMAVRLAMGAGRGRLVRQLLTESLLLALFGAALGTLFARWASALTVRFLSRQGETVWLDLTPDLRVLGFTIAVATLTGIVFGLVPAGRATRVDPQAAMKAQGRGTTHARLPIAKALVVGQIALSLVLVVTAGLLVGSFYRLVTLDPGFRREPVLLATVDFGRTGIDSARQRLERSLILEKLRALPGVRSAAASNISPISGSGWNENLVAGVDSSRDTSVWFNSISPQWFTTLGTPLLSGRDFTDADRDGAPKVAIVSAAMAAHYFPHQNPVGKTFQVRGNGGTPGAAIEIVGMVGNASYGDLEDKAPETAYLPMTQGEWFGTHVIYELRAEGDPNALIPAVTRATAEENPGASLDFVTFAQQVADSVQKPRLLATVSGFFGALALLLAVIGLYGTMAYGVAQRRSEIGIRIALGAARARVLRMVLGEAGALVAAGAVIGLAITLLATKLVAAFLFGVTPSDPPTLALSAALLAVVALAAGAIPAWRAASVDPAETLRAD